MIEDAPATYLRDHTFKDEKFVPVTQYVNDMWIALGGLPCRETNNDPACKNSMGEDAGFDIGVGDEMTDVEFTNIYDRWAQHQADVIREDFASKGVIVPPAILTSSSADDAAQWLGPWGNLKGALASTIS